MSYRKKNSANTFPPQVSLLLSPIRKEDEKSQHKNGKIAVTAAISFSDSRKSFHICNSCFWCASYYMIDNQTANDRSEAAIYSKCPICNKKQIESIPILGNEIDILEYNPKRKYQS
jgi:hypothetical protein